MTPTTSRVLLPGLQERWRDRLYVVRSQASYIEIADPRVSKSGALAWLCARLGVARERTVACGDGHNDVDMLRWAGLGVAVAEAAPEVRAAADVVVPRDGLPALLARLAVGRGRVEPAASCAAAGALSRAEWWPHRPKAAPGGC